jgi:hypothetical protein
MGPRLPAALLVTLAALPGAVAAQPNVGASNPDPTTQAVGGFLGTLVVGFLLVVAAPGYTDRVLDRAREQPLASFGWGVGVLVAFIGTAVLLAITVVGVVLLVPLVVVFVVVAIAGNALGYIALLETYPPLSNLDSRVLLVVLAAVLAGVTSAIPVLGDVVGFVVGSVGVGAIVLDWRR